ncbi:hypothetical protein N7467_001944 [Penicillium canescens]|nr:hypothetical protein N7467_001944 [Penicillium canescens]
MYSANPSRKQTRGDAIKRHSRKAGKAASKYDYGGSVINDWRPLSQELGTPWLESTLSSLHIGFQLDHEILGFYNWAKPQENKNIFRRDLVEQLNTTLERPEIAIYCCISC